MQAMKLLIVIFMSSFLSSCMMATGGMHSGGMMEHHGIRSGTDKDLNSAMDEVVNEITGDLSNAKLGFTTVAIWGIESNNPEIHAEMLEDKLVIQIVREDLFKVVDRTKLKGLLEEQELSLSGAIGEKNASEIGNLIGVDGFLYGTVSIHEQTLILSVKAIKTVTGVIVWAKETKSKMQRSTSRH